jgi:hypothetical protein
MHRKSDQSCSVVSASYPPLTRLPPVSHLLSIVLMHAVSHSLAHRLPPATRTRVRWQLYNSILSGPQSTPNRAFLIPPSSSVSPPPQSSSKLCDPKQIRQPSIPSMHPTPPIEPPLRDGSRTRYVIGLVGQSCRFYSTRIPHRRPKLTWIVLR